MQSEAMPFAHTNKIHAIAVNPNGSGQVMTAGADGLIHMWQVGVYASECEARASEAIGHLCMHSLHRRARDDDPA
jgi:hypothetical protein